MSGKTKFKSNAFDYEKLETCGQCQMSLKETAIICGISDKDLSAGEPLKCYMKGKLEAELAVRRALVQKAQDGDTSAQKEFLKIAENTRIDVE